MNEEVTKNCPSCGHKIKFDNYSGLVSIHCNFCRHEVKLKS